MIVSSLEYYSDKTEFFKKHINDFETKTSTMDEYSCYHKEYIFSDGAIWYEVMSPETVTKAVEINRCKVTVEVKMFRVEYYSSDNASSKFYYEKY